MRINDPIVAMFAASMLSCVCLDVCVVQMAAGGVHASAEIVVCTHSISRTRA